MFFWIILILYFSLWRSTPIGLRALATKVPGPVKKSQSDDKAYNVGDKIGPNPQQLAVPDESSIAKHFPKKIGSPFHDTANVVDYALARTDDLMNWARRVSKT